MNNRKKYMCLLLALVLCLSLTVRGGCIDEKMILKRNHREGEIL